MLTGKVLVDFLTVALMYAAACCLCMAFSYCIVYMFVDPWEDSSGRELIKMLVALGVVVVLVLLGYVAQKF